MKTCSWDIEIAAVIPDGRGVEWSDYRPYGITCAAAHLMPENETVVWHNDYAPRMSPESCKKMFQFLWNQKGRGYEIVTWNGASFDFDCLAEECPPADFRFVVGLAQRHVDPALQMMRELGFMCGLAAAAEGCGLGGKTMKGADAPIKWAGGEQDLVLEYVAKDARLTGQVYQHILDAGCLPYYSKRYHEMAQWIPQAWRMGNRLLTVEGVGALPPPPGRPWRTYEQAVAWMGGDDD